jgi:hypothetical protein
MGQYSNQNVCNSQLLKSEVIKKILKNVDEEILHEFSLQLYEFTKLILEQIKNEN